MLVFTLVAILLHGMKTSDTIIVSRTEDLGGGWLNQVESCPRRQWRGEVEAAPEESPG